MSLLQPVQPVLVDIICALDIRQRIHQQLFLRLQDSSRAVLPDKAEVLDLFLGTENHQLVILNIPEFLISRYKRPLTPGIGGQDILADKRARIAEVKKSK